MQFSNRILLGENMIQQINKCTQLAQILISQTTHSFNTSSCTQLPKQIGVYVINEIVNGVSDYFYIGQSNDIHRRIYKNHFLEPEKYSSLYSKLKKQNIFTNEKDFINHLANHCNFQYLLLNNPCDVNQLEHFAIAVLTPKHNN
jgi:hypothetical protein